MSLNEPKKEEPRMSAIDLIASGLRAEAATRQENCEILMKEIDAIAQKIMVGLPKEDAPISFEERKRAQGNLAPLKEDYARKRGELFRKVYSGGDPQFRALIEEHFRQLDKMIDPANAGRELSSIGLIASGLMKTHVNKTPSSSAPAKTEIKTADSNSAIPEAVRQEIVESDRRMKSIMLEMWQLIDKEITPENFEERRARIIEKFNAIKVGKKETDGSGGPNG